MPTRRLPLTLALVALPALAALGAGCSPAATQPAPLAEEALAAVADKPGVPRERLARAVDALFADDDAGETRALVVYSAGRIVAERYAPGYDRSSRLLGWSMGKSVTGILIGLLVADGRLRLDESVPVPTWQRSGDPRGEITLRQLLQMRSGLRHREGGQPVARADEVRMLFLDGRDNSAAYAEAQPLAAEPGSRFQYSSATSVILADIAARTLSEGFDPAARQRAVGEYLKARLFVPLGLRSMTPEYDNAGTMLGAGMIHATARDWGRLGEFLRHGGAVSGAQLLPRGWVEFMTRPSPRNPAYGAQLWLNRPQGDGQATLLQGRAPASLFAAVGHGGQYLLVSPTQKLTVVRLGKSDPAERAVLLDRLAAIVAVFPEE